MTDLETPMGNAELRLSLASIESEIADVKSIAMDTHVQAKKTNGRVSLLEKWQYGSLVGLAILTPIVGWIAVDYLNHRDRVPSQIEMQAAVTQALQDYKSNK